MYKVKPPTKQELDDFYDAYAPRIQTLMQEVANGNLTIPLTLGTSNKVQLTLKVQQGSTTWHFLTVYSQDANLKKLLCGKWQDHMSIINAIVQRLPGLSWQKRMLKTEYDAGAYAIYGQDANGYGIVENFNDIIYWIFVDQIYEGNDIMVKFDKTDFVKNRGLKICPYCGRQWVDIAEDGVRVSKPNIDHFLPKSKYPFLAMSYFNMIPACHTCNERENKGDMDPILYPGHELKLLNPYEFYDDAVTFSYN